MTLTPNRNYRVIASMDTDNEVDFDLLDFQEHQATERAS